MHTSTKLNLNTTESLIEKVEVVESHELDAAVVMGPGVDGAIGRVRFRHHRVAQLLAAGLKNNEIAELVGDTPANIGLLQRSPAFAELVNSYLEQGWAEIEAVTRRARLAASAGVMELHKRFEQAPETVTTKDLTNATLGLLDRGGVLQKHVVFTGGLSREDLRSILDSAHESRRVVDVSAASVGESEMGGVRRLRAVSGLSEGEDGGAEGGAKVRAEALSGAPSEL